MKDYYGEELLYEYSVKTVLFGTDDSILQVNLKDGFNLVRRSLIPKKDHLDKAFGLDGTTLRREYEEARIDEETLDVICVEKVIQIYKHSNEVTLYYDEQVQKDLISLDNQIRTIRLLRECPLRCKQVFFEIHSNEKIDSIMKPLTCNSSFPISEARMTREYNRFHCEKDEAAFISGAIQEIKFPFQQPFINTAHRYYDLSYHLENYIAMILLFSALEMLFLNKGDSKKSVLAKRCSYYIGETKVERKSLEKELTDAYRLRSEFVHEGNFQNIPDEKILFLRKCVRKIILDFCDMKFDKKTFIENIQKKIRVEEGLDPEDLHRYAEWAFIEAEHWNNAVTLLLKEESGYESQIVVMSLYVIELYLKAILLKKEIEPLRTHDLLSLYKMLEDSEKAFISKDVKLDDHFINLINEKRIILDSFEKELKYLSNGFVDLRYEYDAFKDGKPIALLSDFVNAVLKNTRKLACMKIKESEDLKW